MRSLHVPFLLVAFVASWLAPFRSRAQAPRPPSVAALDERLKKVEAEIVELRRIGAELPSVQSAVADLLAQMAGLRERLDALERGAATAPDARAKLDELDGRVFELTQQVATLRAQVQAQAAPEGAAPTPGGVVGYDKGFLVGSEDGRFVLVTKGYAQLRYTGRVAEGERLDDPMESAFALRRARIAWNGHLWDPDFKYALMLDFGLGRAQLLDYYAEGALPFGFWIRGGQFKVPFSRNFLVSASSLSFLERSVATEEFRYDRDLGLSVGWRGLGGRLDVALGLFNGAGRNVATNDNVDPLLSLRVEGTPLGSPWKGEEGDFDHVEPPGLSVGGAVTFENAPVPGAVGTLAVPARPPIRIDDRDVNDDGERDNVRIVELTLDAAFRFRGLGVEAEWYRRDEDWGAIGLGQATPFAPETSYTGWFAQATYFLVPQRYQVGARFSWTEVSPLTIGGKRRPVGTCGAAPDTFECELPVADARTELSVLFAYYRHRHGVEWAAMYSWLDWKAQGGAGVAGDLGEHRLLVEAQVAF